MFGFFIGTVCLVLLFAHLRRRHYYAAYGPWGGDDYDWPHGFGRGGFGRGGFWHGGHGFRGGHRRYLARRVLLHLDTTPGQEKAIRNAVETLRSNLMDGRSELSAVRRDVAQAFGGDVFDEQAINAAIAKQEAFVSRARGEIIAAMREVHEALDGRQRRQLAEWIAGGFSPRDLRGNSDWL